MKRTIPPIEQQPNSLVLGAEEPVDFAAFFGNDRPVELEIGSGKGGFLLRQARTYPGRNYLGIEWANKFYRYSVDRMRRWGLTNVRILRTDARDFLVRRVPDCSIEWLHVYFPDPWPKKRHHKRRLFTPDFVQAVVRTLPTGGRLTVATDHAEYFEQIERNVLAEKELKPTPFADLNLGTPDGGPETNYEIKYLRQNRCIYRLACVRQP